MAVTFDAVGPSSAGASASTAVSTLSWTHTVGAGVTSGAVVVFVNVDAFSTTGITCAVTCAGTSMASLGSPEHTSAGTGGYVQGFYLAVATTGAKTIAVTLTGGTVDNILGASLSFSGVGGHGTLAVKNTDTSPNITVASNTSGNLIAGALAAGTNITGVSGAATQRTQDNVSTANDTGSMSTSTAPATGSSVTLTWTGTGAGSMAAVAVEVQGAPAAPPAPPVPLPQLPPGWFPGAGRVTAVPGGVPFAPLPGTTDAAPAVIMPPTPEPAPVQLPQLPPGWFPGADKVTTGPGGIPFAQQPAPADPSQAVLPPPAPDILGIPDWLPLPPGWFPGASLVTTDPGSIPFYSLPQPQIPAVPPPPPPVITGLAGGGTGWFTDQFGNPRFLMADNPWALIPNAGRWGGGTTWQSDLDTYCGTRGGQRYTAIYLDPLGNLENNGAFADGRTWDGVYPFTVNGTAGSTASLTGSETIGLNPAFWARVDYFLAACARNGMTGMLNVAYEGPGDFATGANPGAFATMTAAQFGQYGTALAARYAAAQNIIWMVGNDYFGGTGGSEASDDSKFDSLLSGLRSGGDAHLIGIHNFPESDARFDYGSTSSGTVLTWGTNHSQFNGSYSYNVTYLQIEKAYQEASPIPVMQLDGYFYQGGSSYFSTDDRAFRQDFWHAASSGARGVSQGSESVWQWTSASLAASGTDWFHVNNAGNIRALVESLPGWQSLIPDFSSALVTSGRGSRHAAFPSGGGGGQYEPAFTDSFVTASRVPDGSLALIYLSHASTITIDQSKMVAGYTATWADPVSGVTYAGTAGASYNSGAADGAKPVSNSQGDPDWVLVLQGTAAAATPGAVVVAPGPATVQSVTW